MGAPNYDAADDASVLLLRIVDVLALRSASSIVVPLTAKMLAEAIPALSIDQARQSVARLRKAGFLDGAGYVTSAGLGVVGRLRL